MQQEQDGSREHRETLAKKSVVNIATVTAGFTVGTLSYMLYNLHAGKVIRDRVRAALPFPQRFFAVALPFLGFATALVVARRSHDVPNGYRNWFPPQINLFNPLFRSRLANSTITYIRMNRMKFTLRAIQIHPRSNAHAHIQANQIANILLIISYQSIHSISTFFWTKNKKRNSKDTSIIARLRFNPLNPFNIQSQQMPPYHYDLSFLKGWKGRHWRQFTFIQVVISPKTRLRCIYSW